MDIVAKLFNINDSSTCIFGGTLIDINAQAGYDKDRMNPQRNDNCINPKFGLCMYPLIKEIQNGVKSNSFPLSLMDTWINGFIPSSKSLAYPDKVCSDVAIILDKLSIVKTSQLFINRSELLETLFYFFSFYGQQDRILNLDTIKEENKEALINKGLVCDSWASRPLPIRYVIRREGRNEIPDYLYFIGGSELLIADDFSETIDVLKNIYETVLYKKQIDPLPLIIDNPNKLSWQSLTENFFDINNIDSSLKNYVLKTIEFNRILTGIICIRNYFYYAYHEMGIESIVDFNGNDIKKVSTKKILDNYEDIYQYCKTITLLWKK